MVLSHSFKLIYSIFIFSLIFALISCAVSSNAHIAPTEAAKQVGSSQEGSSGGTQPGSKAKPVAKATSAAEPEPVTAEEGAAPMPDSSAASESEAAGDQKSLADAADDVSERAEEASLKEDEVPEALYLSADDSNSTASAVVARKLIRSGRYVHPDIVRSYEFLNYYDFNYPEAAEGSINIIPEMRAMEEEGRYSLQVGVRSPSKSLESMPPLNITFLLDNSGSMAGESINLAKSFILAFVDVLRGEDRVSLVTCNRSAQLVLSGRAAGPALYNKLSKEILPEISVNDVTDLDTGIRLAYELAAKQANYGGGAARQSGPQDQGKAERLHRLIVLSDGAANAGEMSLSVIGEHAEDSTGQGIYLAGVGFGEGFNDSLMNALTDRGRGAYLFIDSEEEIEKVLSSDRFPSYFDLSFKDIRLKMQMPAGWKMEVFHGEQVSTVKSEVIPQYLGPGDQMIYHLELSTVKDPDAIGSDLFDFALEYTPLGGNPETKTVSITASQMLDASIAIEKGDAIISFTEMLKEIWFPLQDNREHNLEKLNIAMQKLDEARAALSDPDLAELSQLAKSYERILKYGEQLYGSRDQYSEEIDAVLGLSPNNLLQMQVAGSAPEKAVRSLERLGRSARLVPMEGYRFLALSTGPIWNPSPAGTGQLEPNPVLDPLPKFMGYMPNRERINNHIYDLHKLLLRLKAPRNARNFSFDFNFFSAEYPQYVNQNYNDSFYAILKAPSTNNGEATNIAFDANNNSIEVDNNYFQNPFHPIPNRGTGFDAHGSTGWLRTSWPISGGEEFELIFSIHDEGDAVFDSLVILDNFRFHSYDAIGTTDPLN